MAGKFTDFVTGRNAGDSQAKSVKDLFNKREIARSRRVTRDEVKALKQEPSSQKPVLNGLAGYNSTPPPGHDYEDERQKQGVFDTASVAQEDFDVTKSSINVDEGYVNENGAYPGSANGYQNGHHNNASQDFAQHDQHYQPEAVEQNHAEYYDDESGFSDAIEDRDEEDDRTMNANEMMGVMQQNGYGHPEVLKMVQITRQDPKFAAFTEKMSKIPHRPNGPNHFASQPNSYAQQAAYQASSSTLPPINHRYQREINEERSPTEIYGQRRTTSLSPVRHGNEWVGQSDNLNGEDQVVKGSFAPSVEGPDDLLRRQPQGQFTRSNQSSEEPEVKNEPIQPDYDEDQLYKMDYAALREQPFDAKPEERPSNKSVVVPSPAASLEDRLAMVSKESREQQEEYFSHMSKEEWEKSGDWFIDRFTELMKKMKEARQSKRDISKSFEDEISAREAAVRGKTVGIERVLREMKTGGEGVLRRKM